MKEDKPLKAIDFCYHDENEMVTVLDCISLCVMVIAYAADSVRGQQMLVGCQDLRYFYFISKIVCRRQTLPETYMFFFIYSR